MTTINTYGYFAGTQERVPVFLHGKNGDGKLPKKHML
jgi:hypothetical protein